MEASTDLGSQQPALMGLARLMTQAFQHVDLAPLAQEMIARASTDEQDGNALMDLATILQLQGIRDVGLATLEQALQVQRLYTLEAAHSPSLRLLALMAPGDLMANAPLPFLIDNSDISLSMLYLVPGEPLPAELPPHDLACIAMSESSANRTLLHQLAQAVAGWRTPVIIKPECVLLTARDQACKLLQGVPGLSMPGTAQVNRAALQWYVDGHCTLTDMLAQAEFPLIVRPVDSHAGHGLDKVDTVAELATYLGTADGDEFFVSRFVDYRSPDGLFRKYRVVLIDGVPFAGHMGVSSHWMIHYLNAGMTDSAAKRAEEEAFMRDFETGFAKRHGGALKAMALRFGLEYLVVDCGETPDGELLVFEVDPGAVVHAMDPIELFPYKPAAMQKIFRAFRTMLRRAAHFKDA